MFGLPLLADDWPCREVASGRSLPVTAKKQPAQTRCNGWSERIQMPAQFECKRLIKCSAISPPSKSGTLPINIAPQNNSGGDVFNVIVTGDGIPDPVQVIDGSRFDFDDQVELATDRGHATDLRVLRK